MFSNFDANTVHCLVAAAEYAMGCYYLTLGVRRNESLFVLFALTSINFAMLITSHVFPETPWLRSILTGQGAISALLLYLFVRALSSSFVVKQHLHIIFLQGFIAMVGLCGGLIPTGNNAYSTLGLVVEVWNLSFAAYVLYLLYHTKFEGDKIVRMALLTGILMVGLLDTVSNILRLHLKEWISLFSFGALAGIATALEIRFFKKYASLHFQNIELEKSFALLKGSNVALLHKEKLAAYGKFAAVIAHEVRNPLAVLQNAISLLNNQEQSRNKAPLSSSSKPNHPLEPSFDMQSHLVEMMEEEVDRLGRLVEGIERLTSPAPTLNKEPVHIQKLVRDAFHHAKTRIKKKVQLQEEFLVSNITCHADSMEQILINLFENAMTAFVDEDNAEHVIKVKFDVLPSDTSKRTFPLNPLIKNPFVEQVLTIEDNGPGIPTHITTDGLEDLISTDGFKSGIGLHIVEHIVREHEGRIRFSKRDDGHSGTRVTLFFPLSFNSE